MRFLSTALILASCLAVLQSTPHPDTFYTWKYEGVWYESARTKNFYFETTDNVMHIANFQKDGKMELMIVQTDESGKITRRGATGYQYNDIPGNYMINFSLAGYEMPGWYKIMDTDFENYSLVYSYNIDAFSHIVYIYAWILVRQLPVDQALLNTMLGKMEKYVSLDRSKFHINSQLTL